VEGKRRREKREGGEKKRCRQKRKFWIGKKKADVFEEISCAGCLTGR